MKITLLQVKNSSIPAAVGIAACDARFVPLVANAEQRLVMGPNKWWNLVWKYRIAITDGLVTWPREIASIISIAKCGYGIRIHSEWFEFIESGYGLRDADAYCGDTDLSECRWDCGAFDRGNACVFSDIVDTGNEKKLKLYTDATADAADTVTVHGLDWDGNPITETLTLVYPAAVTSTNEFSRIDSIILPDSFTGPIRLYEYDTVALTQRAIGTYFKGEKCPSYRRSYIGGICGDDEDTIITVLAKREFQAAADDTDVLLIGSLPALEEMMMAVRFRQQQNNLAAADHEAKAYEILDNEASHYLGQGTVAPLRIQMACSPGELPILF